MVAAPTRGSRRDEAYRRLIKGHRMTDNQSTLQLRRLTYTSLH